MKYIFNSTIVVLLFLLAACTNLEDINIDPNTSPTANESQVLSSALGFMGYVVDVDLNSASFLWAQYYTWGIGVSIGNAERFVAQPDDYDNYWQRAYANSLQDLKFLTNSESAAFRGVSKTLTAYLFQGLVDHFGDVPYSEALSGEISDGGILTPEFDDAATIYNSLIDLMDEAIADLDLGSSDELGAADYVYNGDMDQWSKFAKSLKLRLLMRLSEVDPRASEVQSLIAEGGFIETAGDVAAIPFDGTTGSQNPMYARFEWGVGDFYFASNATVNVLDGLNDPRVFSFYSLAEVGTFAGQIRGINQGTIDDEPFTADALEYSGSSPYAYGVDNSVVLMSDNEVWFLRAEAAARYGTADDDQTAFENAVNASFAHTGADGAADYITALDYGSAANLDAKLDMIAVQKWISLNGTQEDEGWVEARRFDRPASRLFTDGIWQNPPLSVLPAGTFPASWLYPASERSLNPNAPSQRAITDKLFWDN
jgi:hypothetical protein